MAIIEAGAEFAGELGEPVVALQQSQVHEAIQAFYPAAMLVEWDAQEVLTYHKSNLSRVIARGWQVEVTAIGPDGSLITKFDPAERPQLDEAAQSAIRQRAAANAAGLADSAIIIDAPERADKYARSIIRIVCD